MFITVVYAKWTGIERKDLWVNLEATTRLVTGTWCIGGDFNVILDPSENLRGNTYRASKSFDIISCMDYSGVLILIIWNLPIHGVIIIVLIREYRWGWIEFLSMIVGISYFNTLWLDISIEQVMIINICLSWQRMDLQTNKIILDISSFWTSGSTKLVSSSWYKNCGIHKSLKTPCGSFNKN